MFFWKINPWQSFKNAEVCFKTFTAVLNVFQESSKTPFVCEDRKIIGLLCGEVDV